jgi:membrane dipeptidase
MVTFDGLIVANWSPDIFRAMRAGNITAANATCAVWENAQQTIANLAQWSAWFIGQSDLILQVLTTGDIERAERTNRTGVLLGFQNLSPIEDRIELLALYKHFGVGIMQLTYNSQNLVGAGCLEDHDPGLSGFGRDVVAEMNRLGIAIDLSHVGRRTAAEAIEASRSPVVFSHVVPEAVMSHPRNRPTAELQAVVDRGGMIGVTCFPAFLPAGPRSTIDDYAEIIERTVGLCGEDNVGIGTDSAQGHGPHFWEWIAHDKGTGRRLSQFDNVTYPAGIARIEDTQNLVRALERRSWPTRRIEQVMGLNWIAYLRRAWQETAIESDPSAS